tara:strand:- start:4505 stop:4636 length:132 start_codon:yes stop_codon:yes gene_type:complete
MNPSQQLGYLVAAIINFTKVPIPQDQVQGFVAGMKNRFASSNN